MKKFMVLALCALVALPASAAGVTISGYVDLGYWAAQNPQVGQAPVATGSRLQAASATNGGWNGNNQFALNEVNIDLTSQLTNDITVFLSFDFMNGAGSTVDYAYVDLANPGPFDLNLRLGRVPSVVGIEQTVSEANQNNFVNLSLLSPITVGSQNGMEVYGSFNPVNYTIAITNHDNIGPNSIGVFPRRPGNNNGDTTAVFDNNNDRSISGRIGLIPMEGLELGVSASRDIWASPAAVGIAVDKKNPARNVVGFDVTYTWGALTLKGEFISLKEEAQNQIGNPMFASINWRGYYAEGWYDYSQRIGVGVRYSSVRIRQDGPIVTGPTQGLAADYSTLAIAGAYRIADNITFKAEYDINRESLLNYQSSAGREVDNNVIAASLVGTF